MDGKPGHENQTLGLAQALAELIATDVFDIPVKRGWRGWPDLMAGRCGQGRGLPDPDLLLGAGHATHAAMLACRRARGGRAVVLMGPSLPRRWFDLCIVPEHDGVPPGAHVLLTRGVLNPQRPAPVKDADLGLILVGGPSRHYGWDEQSLCGQVAAIVARDKRHWVLATSRRTPASTVAALRGMTASNLDVVPSDQTAPGWLATQLAPASVAWVSEDSVSMLYEALTAGAACGVLPVPVRRAGRVRAGLQALLDAGVIGDFEGWLHGRAPVAPDQPFNEAVRCARWIMRQWFAN